MLPVTLISISVTQITGLEAYFRIETKLSSSSVRLAVASDLPPSVRRVSAALYGLSNENVVCDYTSSLAFS